jgi:hypothetical protein
LSGRGCNEVFVGRELDDEMAEREMEWGERMDRKGVERMEERRAS